MLKNIYRLIIENKLKSILIILGLIIILQYFSLPNNSIISLRTTNPKTTALMELRKEESANSKNKFNIKYKWVPSRNISNHLKNAIIIAEDGTFYTHEGVDWHEIEESVEAFYKRDKPLRGASTITQQLVKNLYLSPSRNPLRKMKEWIITIRMERLLSKKRILEIYMNVIEWGNGIFGAEQASQIYYGKSASQLTRDEAIRLAAAIPNPRKMNPHSKSKGYLRRVDRLTARMSKSGY
ncbi:MAG: monofunctional biosynthetic peptidoglycan transglycosylase [Ignavibacteria bacterium]|nr:monofunctional biosynthetic peptidoglycan transglycosylase [Bacteroidota bacterium]MSQ46079.1 monofunctional biosynthetic peptidoglycan transglycosylase [Ignavibacteria bacterium]